MVQALVRMFPFLCRLPKTATAPFCPSEVQGVVQIAPALPFWQKLLKFIGPGLLVSIGYMDPGNWATDIEAGAKYGYGLLGVVVLSSLMAMFLQCLAMRLGIVTGKDLARLCRDQYTPAANRFLWICAEISIVACDLAEVLGTALAFHLLLGCTLPVGVALTAFDTLIVLGLKGKSFRHLEAVILGLILTIGACYVVEIVLIHPVWSEVGAALFPHRSFLFKAEPLYLSIGILGATVMPHNLYLHSSIVQTRLVSPTPAATREAIRFSRLDTLAALTLALIVNAAILILAAAAFHWSQHQQVAEIEDAYKLLAPILGSVWASALFGVALLASGQSSTFTGTIAGQVLMEGFLKLRIPCWQRRLITRCLALVPALIGVLTLGDHAVGKMLVMSQVVLSFQLPFALYPLIRFTGNRRLMGPFVNAWFIRWVAWLLFGVITVANVWLIVQAF